ncbi:MAG: dimethylsulfonioproprionate lyase family protein [Pseudomonadota bacterium]
MRAVEIAQALGAAFRAVDGEMALDIAARLQRNWPEIEPYEAMAPAVLVHLEAALCAPDAHPATSRLAAACRALPWCQGLKDSMLPEFHDAYAFIEFFGPDGLIVAEDFRAGIYIQAPESFYPPHAHNAEEFYLPISGASFFSIDGGPEIEVPLGSLSHHPSFAWHATRTGPGPLLSLWAWRGDIGRDSYRMRGMEEAALAAVAH